MHVLVAEGGSHAGRVFSIRGNVVIGRGGDADVQILDKGVSRRHACVFERDDGAIMLVDLASHNGTFVNGETILHIELKTGDRFRIGESVFVLGDGQEPEASQEPDAGVEELRLVSGPVLETTVSGGLFHRPKECVHELHQKALDNQWRFCPACGKLTDSD